MQTSAETLSINQEKELNLHLESQGVSPEKLFNHPVGLFVLFFTEMWERFSYYGMRAILVLFLVSDLSKNGWGWPRPEALQLYALYTGLAYFTPIIGGLIADRWTGYRLSLIHI